MRLLKFAAIDISTMHAFHHLINVHDVIDFRACATSVMREADNGREIVEQVREKTGIKYMNPIPYKKIRKIYEMILPCSIHERIKVLGLNPDRADVIIPAVHIFMKGMQWSDA
ncbi:MAG: hypothetical protein KGY60_04665 [Bacteroidales bacterium]|nr:hypothetical protein [Bacteroidales bacterium]